MEFTIEDILSTIVAAIFICISIMSRIGKKRDRKAAEQPIPRAPLGELPKVNDPAREDTIHADSSEVIIDEIYHKPQPKRKKISKAQRVKQNAKTAQNAINQTSADKAPAENNEVKRQRETFKFKLRDAVIYSEVMTPKFRQEE